MTTEDEREAARRAAREEQERIQEQYRRLLIKQQEFQVRQPKPFLPNLTPQERPQFAQSIFILLSKVFTY